MLIVNLLVFARGGNWTRYHPYHSTLELSHPSNQTNLI